jgi:E3 ubiquitin-protein ligase UBR7
LIPSDSYDGLICSACVKGNHYLKEKGEEEGWMIIEPDGAGFKVVGRPQIEVKGEEKDMGAKREREEETDEDNKRLKLDGQEREDRPHPLLGSRTITPQADLPQEEDRIETRPNEPKTSSTRTKGKGDIFLAGGVREKLANTLDVSPPPQVRHMADNRRKQSHHSHSTS